MRWEGEVRLWGSRVKDGDEQSMAREGKRTSGQGWEGENGMCFLPQLATSLSQDYSVEGMSDSLLNFLQHLREFGLVFQRKV